MDKENTKSQITENLAHVDYESGRCQSMKEHLENVAFMAENSCSLEELKPLIAIIGILHDIGKFGRENQEDFKNILVQEVYAAVSTSESMRSTVKFDGLSPMRR